MNADKQIIEVITDYFKITKQKQVKQLLLNRPKSKEHGDFSSNIAMIMAKDCNQNPRELAQELVDKVKWPAAIEKVEIAGPGFLNFFIKESLIYQTLLEIDKQQERFGTNKLGQEQKTLIEFVSANPTGPLTVGHGRNAVLGDTFARILEANGYLVDREYYFNNAGRQMRVLGESVYHRYMQLIDTNHPFPEDHY
ncbi:MAG: arginine--tRNA ligase, partial [Calditrichaeota bacterium]|nr:arginine--tRNA ligase [Calditrichota bacterium]